MKRAFLLIFLAACVTPSKSGFEYRLVIHGGAGTILKKNMTPEAEAQYQAALAEALRAGYEVLRKGGTALDAVEASIRVMEDSPLFNAGKGAVFTSEGTNELDASIMDGATGKAGAVAGVRRVKNPIRLARLVMDQSPHVLMTGDGAEKFAVQNGMELVDPKYFWTERRWKEFEQRKKSFAAPPDEKFGTVGAAALDRQGNLAAATSTGGMSNKRFGRVGDSPIIGAGTYANNRTCAISCTGHGEFFIRGVIAHDISALMEYKHKTIDEAAGIVILEKLKTAGGTGGVVGIDSRGHITMTFNTEGMYRGHIGPDGQAHVAIYKD